MEKIITALLKNIRALGIEAILMPQDVTPNRPRIELYYAGLELAGIDRNNPQAGNKGWERITFNAEFKSGGTHSRWVTDTIIASRKLVLLNEENMPLIITADKTYNLAAHWKRLQTGRFEYPGEEESSMPVSYVELWQITIAYPANLIGQCPQE